MEKNRSFEVFNKLYHPYKITKVNNVYVLNTMDGDYVVKLNPKINYKKLYDYLYSRSFNYVPRLSLDSRDDMLVIDYQNDDSLDNNQKVLDLITVVSLLHTKTAYYKEVTNDKYKEIYENLKNNIIYMDNYYTDWFYHFIENEYNSPSEYLFLRNYTLIYNALQYCLNKVDEWYNLITDKNKQRVVLVHNNLSLDHFIKNDQDYLISWDNYTFDTPVMDLFVLYKNEWENVSFKEALDTYNNGFNLLLEEKILFNILISMPFKVDCDMSEYDKCLEIRKLINYLEKSSKLIFDN